MKRCTRCGTEKDESEFGKKNNQGKLKERCKTCTNEYNIRYKKDHVKETREYNQFYAEKEMSVLYKICTKCGVNKEIFDFGKGRKECKECKAQNDKKYHLNKKKELKKRTLGKACGCCGELKQNNEFFSRYRCKKCAELKRPLEEARHRVRKLISESLRRKKYKKRSRTAILLCCSFEILLDHLGPKPEADSHMDHICPCSQARNEEELMKLQHYTNFQWLSPKENLTKGDRKTPGGEKLCRKLLNREWID